MQSLPSMESAKIKAILYADIFDYPLIKEELEKWQITDRELGIRNYELEVGASNGYYYFPGREKIVKLRVRREKISLSKIKKAKQATSILAKIPFIKMVAITGALAMNNCKKNDDIDLLIVTAKGTLWLTRGLATILLDLKGLRRKPNDKKITDKICLNMVLEDGSLTLPKEEQDLYGAHEVCQVKPIFDKDNSYQRFLKANLWVRKFLPNALTTNDQRLTTNSSLSFIAYLLFPFEQLIKYLQLLYMRPRRTNEVVTPHMLRFHPKDYRRLVLRQYYDRLRKYYGKKI